MGKHKPEPDPRYCAECCRRLLRTAGNDLIYCCPMGVDGEAEAGNIAAFESASGLPGQSCNGDRFGAPRTLIDVTKLPSDTAELLSKMMFKHCGVAWERDVLGGLRWRLPRYAAALNNTLIFRREGYRVADHVPTADFRVFVTDLGYDSWMAEYGR